MKLAKFNLRFTFSPDAAIINHVACGRGGIGRRARFRFWRGNNLTRTSALRPHTDWAFAKRPLRQTRERRTNHGNSLKSFAHHAKEIFSAADIGAADVSTITLRETRVKQQFYMRSWRNWQTRRIQVPVSAMTWRFESSRPHHAYNQTLLRKGFYFYLLHDIVRIYPYGETKFAASKTRQRLKPEKGDSEIARKRERTGKAMQLKWNLVSADYESLQAEVRYNDPKNKSEVPSYAPTQNGFRYSEGIAKKTA